MAIAFTQGGRILASLAIGLAVWVMLGALAEIFQRSGLPKASLSVAFARLRGLPRSTWGTAFAHFGVGVLVLGIVGATAFSDETGANMKEGETLKIGDFVLTHAGTQRVQGPNFIEDRLAGYRQWKRS